MKIKDLIFRDGMYSNNHQYVKVYIDNLYLFSIEKGYYGDEYYYFVFNGHLPLVIYLPENDIRIAPIDNKFKTIDEAKEASKIVVNIFIKNNEK